MASRRVLGLTEFVSGLQSDTTDIYQGLTANQVLQEYGIEFRQAAVNGQRLKENRSKFQSKIPQDMKQISFEAWYALALHALTGLNSQIFSPYRQGLVSTVFGINFLTAESKDTLFKTGARVASAQMDILLLPLQDMFETNIYNRQYTTSGSKPIDILLPTNLAGKTATLKFLKLSDLTTYASQSFTVAANGENTVSITLPVELSTIHLKASLEILLFAKADFPTILQQDIYLNDLIPSLSFIPLIAGIIAE